MLEAEVLREQAEAYIRMKQAELELEVAQQQLNDAERDNTITRATDGPQAVIVKDIQGDDVAVTIEQRGTGYSNFRYTAGAIVNE